MKCNYFCLLTAAVAAFGHPCELYMSKSLIDGAGYGIFAGKNFSTDQVILNSPTILVPAEYADSTQLSNYVFEADDIDGFYELSLNFLSLINHNHIENSERVFSQPDEETSTLEVVTRALVPSKNISVGEEIYISYGGSDWFNFRSIEYMQPQNISQNESDLIQNGHCLSDVYVNTSFEQFGGYGLFARRKFDEGEIIEIDPVIALPVNQAMLDHPQATFINYCISYPGSSIALLPLGLISMANHRLDSDQPGHNSNLQWHHHHNKLFDASSITKEELLNSHYHMLDVALVANKVIDIGEEIFVDYGIGWLQAWESHFKRRSSDVCLIEDEYPFIHFIEAPIGMFPSHWN